MKTQAIIPVTLLFLLLAVFPACQKESNPNPTDARSKFIGSWTVTKNKKMPNYEVTITADEASSDGVLIYTFGNFGSGIFATASISGNAIKLDPNQEIVSGIWINGGGSYSSGPEIFWTYTIYTGADLDTITEFYRR